MKFQRARTTRLVWVKRHELGRMRANVRSSLESSGRYREIFRPIASFMTPAGTGVGDRPLRQFQRPSVFTAGAAAGWGAGSVRKGMRLVTAGVGGSKPGSPQFLDLPSIDSPDRPIDTAHTDGYRAIARPAV
jgi:hypothetical protein